MDFRCSALDCDDRLTHSQGGGANPPRSQAEFPHVNRMVSLTNASVIQSLLFVVVLDFRSWETSSGDLSVIIDVDDQLLRSNSPPCHVAGGRRWALASPCARSTKQESWCPCCLHWWLNVSRTLASFGEWYSLREHEFSRLSQVMTISSAEDEEKCQVRKMKENSACRAKLLHNPPNHARSPPICRVPSRLVFDSAILVFKEF